MQLVLYANQLIGLVFFLCYAYQMYYILVPFIKKEKKFYNAAEQNRFAVLISARNEAAVIRPLIESIKAQTYDRELIDIFVVADNCTDDTAEIAESCGAHVYKRFDNINIGKGYALNYLLNEINKTYGDNYFDGYFVFDADNVIDSHYIEEMNISFSNGYDILTSYRNSKNYGDNWVSAGYGLWFLREAKYLNYSRMLCDSSCAISGTGYMFSRKVAKELGGWPYYLLTEDIEFTIDRVIDGYKIGFCKDAVFYDEQPTSFKQSIRQRMRWAKGYVQVIANYGSKLLKGCKKGNFGCIDMTLNIMPAIFLTIFNMVINFTAFATGLIAGIDVWPVVMCFTRGLCGLYGMLFAMGAITTVTEWNNIYTSNLKKIIYAFTFPLFMITYIPISIIAFFKKVEWKPIEHNEAKSLADIKSVN